MRSHSRSNISVLISGERVNHNVVLDGVEIELNRIIPEDALILCILQHGNKTDRLSIPRFNLSGYTDITDTKLTSSLNFCTANCDII